MPENRYRPELHISEDLQLIVARKILEATLEETFGKDNVHDPNAHNVIHLRPADPAITPSVEAAS